MKVLDKGKYFGNNNKSINFNGLILTDTEYTHKYVGWHYHENPYFTFLLKGKLFEANKKESYYCEPGTLLFHNWQDAHYNIRNSDHAQGFHIEIEKEWFKKYDIDCNLFEGTKMLRSTIMSNILWEIYDELKYNERPDNAVINNLVIQLWSKLLRLSGKTKNGSIPGWVLIAKEIIHSRYLENITLEFLSLQTGIHPVHLCAQFPRYFNSTLTNYIKRLRVEKSIDLLIHSNLKLIEIAYQCGFSDQSHFTREFKKITLLTPSIYKQAHRQ